MKIAVIGGGPAGLYFAYLMKRRSTAHEIRVYEQNPPDATFGFGVVFSGRALEFLEADDQETYRTLRPLMEIWDDFRIVHRDRVVAIDGNGFSAIGRLELLHFLQQRCLEVGVEICFEHPVASLGMLKEADLIIGADGINSLIRRSKQHDFTARETMLNNRFVWYGTSKTFDCLTLTFRSNADGAFCAHHYRYAPESSTFLVECDAETWHRAGFATMADGDSRAYCEQLFAPDLDGHRLLSNRSLWRQFPLISNRHWSAGRWVLVGDALRTVHFSIGSGTRLAMEDAIALAQSLADLPGDLAGALQRFEAHRRPPVEAIVAAADLSAAWYERMAELMALAPFELAYSYMTRTGRVGDDRLQKIAPKFMVDYRDQQDLAP